MDANARRGGPARRTLVVGAIVVGLATIVAIASSGSVPAASVSGGRRPSETLADTLVSLTLVALALSAVAAAVLMSFFGRYAGEGGRRPRRSSRQAMFLFLGTVALVALCARLLAERRDGLGGFFDGAPPPGDPAEPPRTGYQPEFAVWPVVGVLTLLAVALAAWWLSARARRKALGPPARTPHEALADVIAATLDDLRAERDPRRAVIGAYARMERSFAAVGLPRSPAEAPEEYVERALAEVAISQRSAERLTALFAWARFSPHEVRLETKDEAIGALERIQEELAAAEIEREARLAGAFG